MMPSEPDSARPCNTALRVCEDETLKAGKAKPLALAVSSISAYCSGVAMGMKAPSEDGGLGRVYRLAEARSGVRWPRRSVDGRRLRAGMRARVRARVRGCARMAGCTANQ